MALQKNITLHGGVVVNNSYVRIHSVEAIRKNEDSDWKLEILVTVYKDSDTRNAKLPAPSGGMHHPTYGPNEGPVGSGAVQIPRSSAESTYVFPYDPESEQGDFIALAYDKLKTHEDFSGASDV